MFESLKIYKGQKLDLESTYRALVDSGYRRVSGVAEEGDFSAKGENIFVFPATFEYPIRVELDGSAVAGLKTVDPASYRTISEHQMVMLLPMKGMIRKRVYRPKKAARDANPIDTFVDIEPRDFVVHTDYGIGMYLGMERVQTKEGLRDRMVIEYKGGDRLYVPFEDLGKIQKYLGFEKKPPKLYRMGSGMWRRAKEKAKKGAASIACEILDVQARRSAHRGFRFSADTDWQSDLERSFPYKETKDQARAASEVKKDMEKTKPMDRLLCGDVGYGKTEVALRAAFKAVMDNKQVAILVPTTILAEQHYTTFTERMKRYPVNIEMLSRFRTAGEQKTILGNIEAGGVDVIIGTHRLLSGDIKFKNLGLLIIDEEQRFGVRHKERLKRMRFLVDVLTLTATPIPRTLYLALMGGRDISAIDTPPLERMPVKTFITEFNPKAIKGAVEKEMSRGGQVYFVHNRIHDIEKIYKKLKNLLPKCRIALAHGRMHEKELEKTMRLFIKGGLDILLSTNIIESGIDIPNANTIFIDQADTFGLADLYQLRGRVGRFNVNAFCYLIVEKISTLTGDVQKRLDTIKKYQELGSGFRIAMQDLQIRGAGNLLGTEQHGFIEAVGFDLYCRLLRDAIQALK